MIQTKEIRSRSDLFFLFPSAETGWLHSAPGPCALGAASVPSALHPCPDVRFRDDICGSKSRIGLIINGSGVKNPQLSAGDVQKRPSPPNPDQKRVQTRPNPFFYHLNDAGQAKGRIDQMRSTSEPSPSVRSCDER